LLTRSGRISIEYEGQGFVSLVARSRVSISGVSELTDIKVGGKVKSNVDI